MTDPARERMLRSAAEKRAASAYVIEGEEGVGRLKLARDFASALCCEDPGSGGDPCGACGACRRIADGVYPDVTELYPEDGKAIPVAKIRELISQTALVPSEGQWRVFIIYRAELMRAEAQNALLKSMEEPPEGTVFILITSDKSALLRTVLSRCLCVTLKTPTEEELTELLKKTDPGADPEKLSFAAAAAGGSPQRARELMEGGALWNARQLVTDYLSALAQGKGLAALTAILSPAKQDRASLALILPLLELGLRDVTVYQSAGGKIKGELLRDPELIRAVAGGISPQKAARLFDRAQKILSLLSVNVNPYEATASLNLLATS